MIAANYDMNRTDLGMIVKFHFLCKHK